MIYSSLSEHAIWFVGDWIQEKLLGIQIMDIDAVLIIMTCMQFSEGLGASTL